MTKSIEILPHTYSFRRQLCMTLDDIEFKLPKSDVEASARCTASHINGNPLRFSMPSYLERHCKPVHTCTTHYWLSVTRFSPGEHLNGDHKRALGAYKIGILPWKRYQGFSGQYFSQHEAISRYPSELCPEISHPPTTCHRSHHPTDLPTIQAPNLQRPLYLPLWCPSSAVLCWCLPKEADMRSPQDQTLLSSEEMIIHADCKSRPKCIWEKIVQCQVHDVRSPLEGKTGNEAHLRSCDGVIANLEHTWEL